MITLKNALVAGSALFLCLSHQCSGFQHQRAMSQNQIFSTTSLTPSTFLNSNRAWHCHSISKSTFLPIRPHTHKLMNASDPKNEKDDEKHAKMFEDRISGITLKMAFDNSENWGVADNAEEKSERFTSPASLDLVHRLRRESDCVLVGRGTVERDDCTLTVRRVPLLRDRDGNEREQPVRVVIDPNLTLLGDNKDECQYSLLRDDLSTIIYHSLGNDKDGATTFGKGNMVTLVNLSVDSKQISPQSIVDDLASRNIKHVMVEGGPLTALSFLQEKLVDRAIIIKAPVAFKEPVLSNMSEQTLVNSGLEKLGSTHSDGDIVEYWCKQGLPWPSGNDFESWP